MNKNVELFVKSLAGNKKLCDEYARDLQEFPVSPQFARDLMLYTAILAILQEQVKTSHSKALFEPTGKTLMNIKGTAIHVLLSGSLLQYKGTVSLNAAMKIIQERRFDLPPDIEQNHADWANIKKLAGDTLTQVRGRIKKQIVASVEAADKADNWSIATLAEKVTKNSSIKLCIPVLGRLALMRAVYVSGPPGDRKYWDKLDEFLKNLRSSAGSDPVAIHKAFASVIETDRATYGVRASYGLEGLPATDINANNTEYEYDDRDDGDEHHDDP
ncbi:hypothetical protein BC835DRAFT_1424615 [Cytidiella melzeri]|nr:hypothetical protein BC835DRAFT_1424615 [Cytidiella melzeri]